MASMETRIGVAQAVGAGAGERDEGIAFAQHRTGKDFTLGGAGPGQAAGGNRRGKRDKGQNSGPV